MKIMQEDIGLILFLEITFRDCI